MSHSVVICEGNVHPATSSVLVASKQGWAAERCCEKLSYPARALSHTVVICEGNFHPATSSVLVASNQGWDAERCCE